MKKSALRKKYLERRRTLSKDEVLLLSEKIFENFDVQFHISENQNVHVFLSIEKLNEVNTKNFIQSLWEKKVNVFVPKIVEGTMISVRYDPDTELVENSWGIREPKSNVPAEIDFDYVITPLLYCDTQGNRIGYGKGFYDLFFQSINQQALKIGVNFFRPEENIEDVSATDVTLDYLLTADEVLSFDFTSI